MKSQSINDAKIYRAYIEAKSTKRSVSDIAHDFGISRAAVYDVVQRVKKGNGTMIKKCLEEKRCECVWEYKYRAQFLSLPNDRKSGTIDELRAIIRAMEKDRFPVTLIAKKLGVNRSTVHHHLGK